MTHRLARLIFGFGFAFAAVAHAQTAPAKGPHWVAAWPASAQGKDAVHDAVTLPFVKNPADPMLIGRRLAVSFHVVGESGPMTWNAKALTTSYVTPPGAGAHGGDVSETAFPLSTASWYFLDEVEMTAPPATRVIVAFGDSITDGTASTLDGVDRWAAVFT